MFPFHTWLPDAHTEAPTVGSVLLAAILLKLGTYGFIRIALPILPEAAKSWAPWIGLTRDHRHHLRRARMSRADRHEAADRVLVRRAHGLRHARHRDAHDVRHQRRRSSAWSRTVLITGMLFFIAGSVQHNYGTRELSRLGGLLKQAPKMGWILGFCAMASLGLPGLAGFWGEFPAMLSTFNPAAISPSRCSARYMVIAAVGTVLAAGYLLWMLQKVAFGVPKAEFADAHIHDVNAFEWTAWVPILLADRRRSASSRTSSSASPIPP